MLSFWKRMEFTQACGICSCIPRAMLEATLGFTLRVAKYSVDQTCPASTLASCLNIKHPLQFDSQNKFDFKPSHQLLSGFIVRN